MCRVDGCVAGVEYTRDHLLCYEFHVQLVTVLRNCDQVFGEGGSAIVITKAADGYEGSGGKVLKDVTLLCSWGEGWCERHHHVMCRCHLVAICGKYCGAVLCRCYVCACVYVVRAYIVSRGACVGDGMRLGWDYGR